MKAFRTISHVLLAAAAISAPAIVRAENDAAVLGFEDLKFWTGLEPETTIKKEGNQAARWDTVANDRVRSKKFETDFSKYEGMQISIYSMKATGASIAFAMRSENPESEGPDYWADKILINWEGWKDVRIPFKGMKPMRDPVGLHQITELTFASSGYGVGEPVPGTELILDAMTPYNGSAPVVAAAIAAAPTAKATPAATMEASATSAASPKVSMNAASDTLNFEEMKPWKGLKADSVEPKQGLLSGRWDDTAETKRITCSKFPSDLSGAKAIRFWLYNEKPTGNGFAVILNSENDASDGPDYYLTTVPVTWSGWKQVELNLSDFQAARSPAGFGKIDALHLASDAYGLPEPNPKTVWKFDAMEIVPK